MKDYYKLLGVNNNANQQEIKQSYRRLARKFHPDVNPGPEAAEKFKHITRAYETLSNPKKRHLYDTTGSDSFTNQSTSYTNESSFVFQDIFENFFGVNTNNNDKPSRQQQGNNISVDVYITLKDSVFGVKKELLINGFIKCKSCLGSCCQNNTSPKVCVQCNGSGKMQKVVQSMLGQVISTSLCNLCQGYGSIIENPCLQCKGNGRIRGKRTIKIKIPAGVAQGSRIQLKKQGEAGFGGGNAGDLYIEIKIKNHSIFTRKGNDLFAQINIPMTSAALGERLKFNTFDGEKEINIKPGVQSGDIITIKNLGITYLGSTRRGNLNITVQVETPTKLNNSQKEILKQLANLRNENHQSGKIKLNNQGVFARLRDKLGNL